MERPHLEYPAGFDAGPAGLRLPHLLHLGQGLHGRRIPCPRRHPGRALERPPLVRGDHQAHRRARRGVLPATGNCTAVGWNDAGKALAAHWNGKAWSDESPAGPQPVTYLEDVSCPSTTACVAAGTGGSGASSAGYVPVAEQWTGGSWAALTVPDPAPSGDLVELNSVSCTSVTNCMAVGDDQNAADTADTTVAAQWNGATWTIVSTPSPAAFSALMSVSCSSATYCSAVGVSSPSVNGTVSPVAETWNGATWSLQTAAG
jgi:hypothetical protein